MTSKIENKNKVVVDNTELLAEVIKSKRDKKPTSHLSLILQAMIPPIRKRYFPGLNPEVAEDADSDALLRCFLKLEEFDENRSNNAHAFLTTVIINEIRASLNRDKVVKGEGVETILIGDMTTYDYIAKVVR